MGINNRIKTKPTVWPVTVSEVKTYTRILESVSDTLVDQWIKSATEQAQNYQHRAYLDQEWELSYDQWPPSTFSIPINPVQSVDSIKYYDTDGTENTLSTDIYQVDFSSEVARVSLNFGEAWPASTLRSMRGFVVAYTAGYGSSADDVPLNVKDAIYLYCAFRYENRIAEDGDIPNSFYYLLQHDRLVVPECY